MILKDYIKAAMLFSFAIVMGGYIVLGKKGIAQYFLLKDELEKELSYVHEMEKKYIELQNDAIAWQEDSFEFEKIARDDLQMAFTNEMLYYFPHEHMGTQSAKASENNHYERIA